MDLLPHATCHEAEGTLNVAFYGQKVELEGAREEVCEAVSFYAPGVLVTVPVKPRTVYYGQPFGKREYLTGGTLRQAIAKANINMEPFHA